MSLDLIQGRICELGKIKIGGKSAQERTTQGGGKWRAPEKWDHFKITTMNRDQRGDLVVDAALMQRLLAKYGDNDGKLRQIPVALLSNDIDDVLQCALCWYPGKGIGARADGKTVTWYVDPQTKRVLDAPRVEDYPADFEDRWGKLFKLHTNFSCVILSEDGRWGGVYRFRTTSRISADQLKGSLLQVAQLTGGILRGIPLMMVVRPIQVAPDGKPTTVHVVHVEMRGADLREIQARSLEMARFELEHQRETEKTVRAYRALLTAPGHETPIEQADIAEEFPDAIIDAPPDGPDPLDVEMGLAPSTAAPAPATVEAPAQPPELIERIEKAIERFAGICIGLDELEAGLGKRRDQWGEPELEALFRRFTKDKKQFEADRKTAGVA